jgi:hypothetical protein
MRYSLLPRNLDPDARNFGIGYLLLLPLYLAPLLATRYLPGLDLPFHLAIVDLLQKAGSADNPYAAHYEGGFAVAPYAAHYLTLRLLSVALPLMTAQKVVTALYVATFPLATGSLLAACGRSRVPALLAFPLAYNLTLHYGFISFAISLPVLMVLLSFLARFLTEPAPARGVGLGVATALAAVLLFLCHLQNFLFGLCAGLAFVALARAGWRRRLLGIATFVPAAALLVRWHVLHDFAGPGTAARGSFAQVWRLLWLKRDADRGLASWSHDLLTRLELIPVHLLRGFTDRSDVVVARAMLLVLAGYVVLGLVGLLEPTDPTDPVSARPRLRAAGAITFAGALAAYLVLPHHLPEYELMTFHPRFSVLAVATALLLVPASLRRLQGPSRPLLLLPALVVSFYFGLELFRHYRLYDREVSDFDAVVARTPPGGRALGLVFDRHSRVMRIESALVGLPSLYPVLRPSPTGMVPIFYCGMRHMPCRRVTPGMPMLDLSPWAPTALQPGPAIDFFDYFFVRLPPNRPIFGAGLDRLDLIARQGSWLVYRRKPGPPPAAPHEALAAPRARREKPRRALSAP